MGPGISIDTAQVEAAGEGLIADLAGRPDRVKTRSHTTSKRD